ncbi:rRNA maturation RNase YbeY [Campylobacter vulpis]|uniref:Endoribonuclease YbeY n=1 Tax=Campylobacter vulpis TaxID=1655500 RepID=A0A2G4R604_9BACT|nr:rRNA maturation RNase YbeY [Campylobacter vulpis]MBS4241406.1 rRNA maturation RNase YbeY [Campylobacter vulpis]MBS4252947.1 rRNA maturation RNase YbeY [Campylobacter vulpis]MBS4275836.1 rRNA maturation RNase YbeY [Campylobacter vulpis]MBS4282267.1 rRNA maturation RNase YbeY [Campylobacter vulpis]MBS4307175.1 rRNA maturation RNase YbeY [Campylobacter vulpis]
MILCEEDCKFLDNIAKTLSPKDVELIFVEDEEMRELNLKYRNKNKSTDVLSFPLQAVNKTLPLGSIVINKALAQKKAKEFQHSLEDEISLLFIHAMLHLLGFDHEKDKGEMREKEEELIRFFKLPQSLIVRTEAL